MDQVNDFGQETMETQLTDKQQVLIDRAIAAIIGSQGRESVIEEEAIKVASLAGPLRGNARNQAKEQLVLSAMRTYKPRKAVEPLIIEAMAAGDNLIEQAD